MLQDISAQHWVKGLPPEITGKYETAIKQYTCVILYSAYNSWQIDPP